MNALINELLDNIISEFNKPEIKIKITNELIHPIIDHFTKQLYPYIITTCIIIILMFLCIIGTFIILVQGIFRKT